MRKFRQGTAPVILYSPRGIKLFDFGLNRVIETDDEDLCNLLLAMGAVEIPPEIPPVPQDLTEVAERLGALAGRVSIVEGRSDIRSIGAGLALSGAGELSATGSGGSGGGGQDNVIESISVNGIAQAVDANKNVDLLVPTYSKNTAAFAAYDEGAEFNLQPSTNGMTASWAEGTTVVSSELTSKTYVDANASTLAARVTANETAIAGRYTKEETDQKIAEAMTDVDNEHFHPVTVLPDPQDADPALRPKENHEYVLIEYEQDGVTIKTETHYLFYGGVYHQKPTGGMSLEGYATEEFVNTKTAKMGEFDVAAIPQGSTGANEINAVLSNKDNENTRLSYIRQSDGTLPSTVNLGVKSGLGEDSLELATTGYVNSKALTPTGWGVARTGVATVTFNNSKWSSSATVDVSGLGFSSGADYDVVAQPTTGGTATPWGNAIAFVNADKGASSFSVSSVTMEESLSGTVNVKYTIFAKGYGAVAYTGEIPTGGTTGQILTKRSDADGDYGWQAHGAFTTQGDWRYKINPDNTFEAYYYKNGVSLTIQDTSGNFYRSALQTLNLPTGITSVYDATPLHASVNTSHNNYPCFGTLASVATNQVKYYALSGGSRGASPNYIVTAHVFGTLAAKA